MKFNNFFKSIAAFAVMALAAISCSPENGKEQEDTLSVEPSTPIVFEASANEDLHLTVTTNVKDWTFKAPTWVKATQQGNILIVNAEDNPEADERLGRITINAGKANPVRINVTQAGKGSSPEPEPQGPTVKFELPSPDTQTMILVGAQTSIQVKAKLSLEAPQSNNVSATIKFDEAYLSEYNFLQGAEYSLFDKAKASFEQTLTIKAGQTSAEMTITLDASDLGWGSGFLVPLKAEISKGASVQIDRKNYRVNYVLIRQNVRTVKNVVYMEVNDCNPLNALEWCLEDGTPFIDALILFAANINYDAVGDRVFLHNNPNVQALLDESDVYIQPLREKGIKVYLGLLGNHDAAGLCQLSDWGAAEWSKEVAQACKDYKLDGVNLDDEYSGSPISGNKWFTSHSSKAGSRLMYELKKELRKVCYWPTEVSFFDWGALHSASSVKDQETGITHSPNTFVDFHVANYGSASYPFEDVGMDKCSGASIQLHYGQSLTESHARSIKSAGYGWCMWFAFDPSGTGSVQSNFNGSYSSMSNAAKAFHGQNLVKPTGVYNKKGEGKYDPERHPRK